MSWSVYIILCSDNSLYTGISTDPERRFRQHADGSGAKYFRGRRPLAIVYREGGHSRSSAGRRELQIKRMAAGDKASLAEAGELHRIRRNIGTERADRGRKDVVEIGMGGNGLHQEQP